MAQQAKNGRAAGSIPHPLPQAKDGPPGRLGGRGLGVWGMVRRSLGYRRGRSAGALVALTVSAAVATALLTLYADLDQKLHKEFRSFGANVVVTGLVGDGDLYGKAVKAAGADAAVAEFGYAVATTDRGTAVVVSGVYFPAVRKLNSWWQVDRWPERESAPQRLKPQARGAADGTAEAVPLSKATAGKPGTAEGVRLSETKAGDEALLGQRAAEFIGDEKAVTLKFAGRERTFAGVGRLRTGGDEDSRVYVSQAAFEQWTGVRPSVIEVQVPGGAGAVEAAVQRLRSALPGAKVDPVRQLVEGESKIVERTRALMFGAVLLIALTVGVSVLATLSASVLERRRDFALMKALGGSEGQMMGMFLVETLVLAGAGVVAGYVLGSGLAWGISEWNFGVAAWPRVGVLPVVVVLNVLIACVAAMGPVRALRGLEPAGILKGE